MNLPGVYKEEKQEDQSILPIGDDYYQIQNALDFDNELWVELIGTEDETFIPTKSHEDDAGYDCRALIEKVFVLKPFKRIKIPLGFGINIPKLHTGDLRPRSGLTDEYGLIVGYGTIDAGYTNTVSATIFNLGDEDFIIKPGDRIAQLVVLPTVQSNFNNRSVTLKRVPKLIPLERGKSGHGSTGIK